MSLHPRWLLPHPKYEVDKPKSGFAAKRVQIGLSIYPSARIACKWLGKGENYVRQLVGRGRARYLD